MRDAAAEEALSPAGVIEGVEEHLYPLRRRELRRIQPRGKALSRMPFRLGRSQPLRRRVTHSLLSRVLLRQLRLEVLGRFLDPARHRHLLEIGSAFGFFLKVARERFDTVRGFDLRARKSNLIPRAPR